METHTRQAERDIVLRCELRQSLLIGARSLHIVRRHSQFAGAFLSGGNLGRKSRKKRQGRPVTVESGMRWYHPVLFGGGFLFLIVGARVLFAIPAMIRNPEVAGKFAMAPFVAGIAGAAGGLGYALVGAPLRRVPRVGRYLAGITILLFYLPAAGLAIYFVDPESLKEFREDPVIALISFGIVTVFFGILIGRSWFSEEPGAPI